MTSRKKDPKSNLASGIDSYLLYYKSLIKLCFIFNIELAYKEFNKFLMSYKYS